MLTISSISVSPWPQQPPVVKAQPASATKTSNAVSADSAGEGVSVSSAGDGGAVQASYAPHALPPVDPSAELAQLKVPADVAAPQESAAAVQNALAQRVVVQQTAQNPPVSPEAAQARSGISAQSSAEAAGAAQANPAVLTKQAVAKPFKGELPSNIKYPEQKALDTQINDLVPNLWKASGAAVEVLIGEDAKAAAAARAEVFDKMSSAAANAVMSDPAQEAADAYAAQQAGGSAGQAPGSVLSENA